MTCREHCQSKPGHKGPCLVDMSPEELDAWLDDWEPGHIERGEAVRIARARSAS